MERNGRYTLKKSSALGTFLTLSASALALRQWLRWRRAIDFAGQIAIIVGGSRGLGLAIARELAAEGSRLVLVARDPSELERAQADLSRRGGVASIYVCDIRNRADVERTIVRIAQDYGGIDVLINDAGTIQGGPFTIIAALPHLAKSPARRIVNISPMGGRSDGLHAELASQGIRVTTVSPGLMSAWSAARHIVDACRYGDRVPTIGLPARLAKLASASCPRTMARVMAIANSLSNRATIENNEAPGVMPGRPAW